MHTNNNSKSKEVYIVQCREWLEETGFYDNVVVYVASSLQDATDHVYIHGVDYGSSGGDSEIWFVITPLSLDLYDVHGGIQGMVYLDQKGNEIEDNPLYGGWGF